MLLNEGSETPTERCDQTVHALVLRLGPATAPAARPRVRYHQRERSCLSHRSETTLGLDGRAMVTLLMLASVGAKSNHMCASGATPVNMSGSGMAMCCSRSCGTWTSSDKCCCNTDKQARGVVLLDNHVHVPDTSGLEIPLLK